MVFLEKIVNITVSDIVMINNEDYTVAAKFLYSLHDENFASRV